MFGNIMFIFGQEPYVYRALKDILGGQVIEPKRYGQMLRANKKRRNSKWSKANQIKSNKWPHYRKV